MAAENRMYVMSRDPLEAKMASTQSNPMQSIVSCDSTYLTQGLRNIVERSWSSAAQTPVSLLFYFLRFNTRVCVVVE